MTKVAVLSGASASPRSLPNVITPTYCKAFVGDNTLDIVLDVGAGKGYKVNISLKLVDIYTAAAEASKRKKAS